MAGPWEKFGPQAEETEAAPPVAAEAGPWTKFQEAPKEKERPGLGIMSLPSDAAELGARGIDWAAQKLGATPRKAQPFSFQRSDPSNPDYTGFVKPLVEFAVSGAKLPGDVYTGKVDPLSEEGIKRATQLGALASPVSPAAGTGAAIARAATPKGTFATRNVVEPLVKPDFSVPGGPAIEAPREAGEIVGTGIREAAQAQRGKYKQLFKEASELPGEFKPEAFEGGISGQIKNKLSSLESPVIVDDVTTPIATRALDKLDSMANVKFQNLADPETVTAIDLKGVFQGRKQLSAYYTAARRSNNVSDERALGAIINQYDEHIEQAIANGLFSGDERALAAQRAARAEYSNYAKTFRPQGSGDDVGLAMRRIIDRNATPEEIANMVIGSGKIGNAGLPVRMADRLEKIFGRGSDEWSAIRQGIWQKTQSLNSDGTVNLARSAQNTLHLANSTLGKKVYAPEELDVLKRYAGVLRSAKDPSAILEGLDKHREILSVAGHSVGIPLLGHLGAWLGKPLVLDHPKECRKHCSIHIKTEEAA